MNINERMHVPDAENVGKLIDNIMDKIRDNLIIQIEQYEEDYYDGAKLEYSGQFTLSEINNPCTWLADDNTVEYVADFSTNSTNGTFYKSDKTRTYVEHDLNGNPISLHMSLFSFDIYLGEYMPHNSNEMKSILDNYKADIRHEILHAYKDMMTMDVNKNKTQYIKSYYNLSSMMMKRNFDFDFLDDEKKKDPFLIKLYKEGIFLRVLYMLSSVERDAHVSEFYQEILGDLKKNKKLKPIDEYTVYVDYIKVSKDINVMDSESFGNFRNSVIAGLFGESCKTLSDLKRKLTNIVDDVFDRLKKIYSDVSLRRDSILQSDINITVDESHKLYKDAKLKLCEAAYGKCITDENRIMVKVMAENYHYSYKDQFVDKIRYFFDPYIKFEGLIYNLDR